MSTDDLTKQLRNLTLREAKLQEKLDTVAAEIKNTRNKLKEHHNTKQQQPNSAQKRNQFTLANVGDRVTILTPTKITTAQTPQWIARDRLATITKVHANDNNPKDSRYVLLNDNGTKTWRKATNVAPLP